MSSRKPRPSLFIGIDVAKKCHHAAFLSKALLEQRKSFRHCPVITFTQDRAGVESFLAAIRVHAPLSETVIVLERTGHYHRALVEALQAEGLSVYVIAIHQRKVASQDKTDKRDAQRLANMLYGQVALGQQVDDVSQRVERYLEPIPVAAQLAPLVRLRFEIVQGLTQIGNRLIGLCDEIFPEFAQVIKDVNGPTALDLRARFPTPESVTAASEEQLGTIRRGFFPSPTQLQELRTLAATSIGVREPSRLHGLLLEQKQLIARHRHLEKDLQEIDREINQCLADSREGQILLSIPAIGPQHAAVLLSSIGNIRNFERSSHLRRFAGWAPQSFQTGTSIDRDSQTRTGSRLIKRTIYLVCLYGVKIEPWKSFYERLCLKKCIFDARLGRQRGKMKVMGRVAGTIIGVIFALLKADAALVDATPDDCELPPPQLYDPSVHQAHRTGGRVPRSA